MKNAQSEHLRIGIIGAGFSGTALAAMLEKLTNKPIEIILFEKTQHFGVGHAYSTPFDFHLLNVRAQDMSVFEDDADHFVRWLATQSTYKLDSHTPIAEQFVPRVLYGEYLKDLISAMCTNKSVKLTLSKNEVINIKQQQHQLILELNDSQQVIVDKAILALGNNTPRSFPFPVTNTNVIHNPWDYLAPKAIPPEDAVLIMGTGLSMIDTVLTLYHQNHRGAIYAVSRHGLQPLPHADNKVPFFMLQEDLPKELRGLTRYLRTKSKLHAKEGGDWRSIINALRVHIPTIWAKASSQDKKRFLRHVLPYWNIHRHRVHKKIADLLAEMCRDQRLQILSGRVLSVENGKARIQSRHAKNTVECEIKWIVNCMGPALNMNGLQHPLIDSVLKSGLGAADALDIGFDIDSSGALIESSGKPSNALYTLGPPAKGVHWECSAVPEIRKQSFILAKHLLQDLTQ